MENDFIINKKLYSIKVVICFNDHCTRHIHVYEQKMKYRCTKKLTIIINGLFRASEYVPNFLKSVF